jgi:DNA-binding LytR/AlgR family response regulator
MMRKTRDFFASGGPAHLALRELQGALAQPVTLAALAGVAVIVGISGPFDTLRALPLPARMAYWAAVVPLTYAAGFLGTVLTRPYLPARPRALHRALAALGAALPVTLTLAAINGALGILPDTWAQATLGVGAVYVICLVIEGVGAAMAQGDEQGSTQGLGPTAQTAPPALLARLPIDKRGAIWAISAQDHYITVITAKGRAMLLMRLADAIAEAAPTAGVQIHRSHWVALAGVARAHSLGDGGEVVLHDSATLPIARARMKAARSAQLLPRKGD